ncbi:AP endonuclease [Bacillaceae bacterium JMAK1]|nr:AP endonuclease [Bacillaceae bacterium JMAK1]
MSYKYSLAHLTALDLAPHELTYTAAKAGYDYVSIRPIYMGLPNEPNYDLANKKEMFRDTRKALQETGIELLDIELAKINNGTNPLDYEPAFHVAAELGGKHVLSSIWTEDTVFAKECFAELCDIAKPYGLTVELEFVPIATVSTLQGAVDVLESTKRSNSGLMIDAHHFHRSRDRVEDLDHIPEEWFRYFHLCDAVGQIPVDREEMTRIVREERLYIGEGGTNVGEVLKRIPKIPMSLEMPHKARAKEFGNEEFVRRCLQSAKTFIASIEAEVNKN